MAQPKQEPQDGIDAIKKEIMELIHAYENGITAQELSSTMSSTSAEDRKNAVNALADESKIQICKRGSELIFRAISAKSTIPNLLESNSSIEERAVYQVVESAGSKGIWNREIRNQTKLPMNQMTKVLKNLETKKLIKAVNSVPASKKKVYMLYGLEPDKSVTGGAWYSGTEFESEYVQILHEQCYHFVKRRLIPTSESGLNFVDARNKSLVSSTEVKEYIENLKISNVKLTLQDIEMVLETIVFDGLIEKISVIKKVDKTVPVKSEKVLTSDEDEPDTSNVTYYYRALEKLVESPGVMRVPCGQCSYTHECRLGAVINPENCLYYERWFSKW